MKENKEFLGTAPVGKLLFKLAIPTVVAQLINMLYNIVDRIYIGHIPQVGSLALTGVGVCMPIIMIVTAFAALVSAGGAPRASIFMGKKDGNTSQKVSHWNTSSKVVFPEGSCVAIGSQEQLLMMSTVIFQSMSRGICRAVRAMARAFFSLANLSIDMDKPPLMYLRPLEGAHPI